MILERCHVDGLGDVILTEGMTNHRGEVIYGVFHGSEDAQGDDADDKAIGTVGSERLTEGQREIAKRNSERIKAAQ